MSLIAYLIGVPLGLWMSEKFSRRSEIIAREKRRHAQAMETRFGEDNRKCEKWDERCERVEINGRERRAEFRKRNAKKIAARVQKYCDNLPIR